MHSILIIIDNTPERHSDIESDVFMTTAANMMKAIKDTLRAAKLAQSIPNNVTSLSHSPPPISDLEATGQPPPSEDDNCVSNTVQQQAMSSSSSTQGTHDYP